MSRLVSKLVRRSAGVCLVALSFALPLGLSPVAQVLETSPVAIELNKLEPQGKACQAYFVIDNPSNTAFAALKLDLVFFQTDGTIGRRLAFDLGPLRAAKKTVKTFNLDGGCDTIGSVLVNDVIDCRDAAGPVQNCLDRLKVSSRASATLGK